MLPQGINIIYLQMYVLHTISEWPETLPPMKGAQEVVQEAQEAAQGVKEVRGRSPGGVTRNR